MGHDFHAVLRAATGHGHSLTLAACHVPLLAGAPPEESADPFDPTIGLVVVLETTDRVQLAMAKGLLEDAAIPFFVLGQIATLVQDVDPFLNKLLRMQVPRDREAEARELLAELLEPCVSPLGEGEAGTGGVPAPPQ